MINNRKVVAIIPARGGSKGIPGKNLYKVHGKSLVELAVELAKSHHEIDEVYVSTDCEDIYSLSRKLGVSTPTLRPKHLATDESKTSDVIRNLVETGILKKEDILLLLQPTSPLRSRENLFDVVEAFSKEKPSAVVSVCEVSEPHPYKVQTIENGFLSSFMGSNSSVPRQSLPSVYRLNGAFYLINVSSVLEEDTFVPKRSLPYLMEEINSINLDSKMDLLLLDTIIKEGLIKERFND